jgi:predicted transcriptional regulator
VTTTLTQGASASLAQRALLLLQNSTKPLTRTAIREHLKVNNQRLGDTLAKLDKRALVLKTSKGWVPLGNASLDKR